MPPDGGFFIFWGGLDISLMLWYFNSAIRQRMWVEIQIITMASGNGCRLKHLTFRFCVWDACHPLAGVDQNIIVRFSNQEKRCTAVHLFSFPCYSTQPQRFIQFLGQIILYI
nr:MAG TPA: hypothetical protein [Caudoviricetes sp.]